LLWMRAHFPNSSCSFATGEGPGMSRFWKVVLIAAVPSPNLMPPLCRPNSLGCFSLFKCE
jgi:hypothetical protein